MPRRSGGTNYTPLVRGMVSQALKENRDEVRQAITDAIKANPIQALKDLSWLCPKEMIIESTMEVNINAEAEQADMDLIRQLRQARIAPQSSATH